MSIHDTAEKFPGPPQCCEDVNYYPHTHMHGCNDLIMDGNATTLPYRPSIHKIPVTDEVDVCKQIIDMAEKGGNNCVMKSSYASHAIISVLTTGEIGLSLSSIYDNKCTIITDGKTRTVNYEELLMILRNNAPENTPLLKRNDGSMIYGISTISERRINGICIERVEIRVPDKEFEFSANITLASRDITIQKVLGALNFYNGEMNYKNSKSIRICVNGDYRTSKKDELHDGRFAIVFYRNSRIKNEGFFAIEWNNRYILASYLNEDRIEELRHIYDKSITEHPITENTLCI